MDIGVDDLQLIHQFFVDMQTAGGIDEYRVIAIFFGIDHTSADRFLRTLVGA